MKVIVGDTQVSKTCIIAHLVSNTFKSSNPPTIDAALQTYVMATTHGPATIQIWDTAGQEKYRALAPMYYRSADAALLMFDFTSLDPKVCLQASQSISWGFRTEVCQEDDLPDPRKFATVRTTLANVKSFLEPRLNVTQIVQSFFLENVSDLYVPPVSVACDLFVSVSLGHTEAGARRWRRLRSRLLRRTTARFTGQS
jgi:GTPase SAR1 family protein